MKQLRRVLNVNIGITFILPSLIGVSCFFLIPYAIVLYQSFKGFEGGNAISLQNYQLVLTNPAFRLAIKNTLRFIAICIPILLVMSLAFALILQNNKLFSEFIKTGLLIPLVIPVASIAFFWKLIFSKAGFFNLFLSVFGLQPTDWMNSKAAFWILVFTYVWKNLGYNLILWIAGLASISPSIYEAAKIDGANKWNTLIHITLPNLLPTFFVITVLSILNSFKIFREAYLVAGEYPHTSMYLVQHVFNNWFREMDIGKLAAASIINTVVMMLFIFILQRNIEDD